jgi:hypothetical protein
MPGVAQAKEGMGCNGNARVRVTEIRKLLFSREWRNPTIDGFRQTREPTSLCRKRRLSASWTRASGLGEGPHER